MDRLAQSPWSAPETVAGFSRAEPNPILMEYAARRLSVTGSRHLLDIGCGAGRNAAPLAAMGWQVIGTDLSWPMIHAALVREAGGLNLVVAAMQSLPIRSGSAGLIVAHGIWNLARSGQEFRDAIREAARVASRGAALFVFTFSRHTLPPEVQPLGGEAFVFTEFSGAPQCFLTEAQLLGELSSVGFVPDPALPLRELNRPPTGLRTTRAPVIYEGAFQFS